MSFSAINYVLEHTFDVSSSEKLILLLLAKNTNDDYGCAWPSVSTLARICECSDRNVQICLKSLQKKEILLIIRATEQGPYKTNTYIILPWYQEQWVKSVEGQRWAFVWKDYKEWIWPVIGENISPNSKLKVRKDFTPRVKPSSPTGVKNLSPDGEDLFTLYNNNNYMDNNTKESSFEKSGGKDSSPKFPTIARGRGIAKAVGENSHATVTVKAIADSTLREETLPEADPENGRSGISPREILRQENPGFYNSFVRSSPHGVEYDNNSDQSEEFQEDLQPTTPPYPTTIGFKALPGNNLRDGNSPQERESGIDELGNSNPPSTPPSELMPNEGNFHYLN